MGHARTALLTWLRARSVGGRILMRIEDLDPPRVREGSAEAIMRDHEWLGFDWDEGPVWQSDRDAAYEAALDRLDAAARIYPCTCTRKEIQAAAGNAPHGEDGLPYPGTCRPPLGAARDDRRPAYRFVFDPPSPGFTDLLGGEVPPGRVRGDFIVRRSDGLWAYQLAVVVDDAEMGVTEVIRGDDLLLSTPRQIALYEALGHARPAFAHVGLVRGEDGQRLSKRHGSPPVSARRERGDSPEQVLGWLASSLGLRADASPVSLEELVDGFSLERVARGDVVAPAL